MSYRQVGNNGCAYVTPGCNIVGDGDDGTPTVIVCPHAEKVKVAGANCSTKNHGQDLDIDWAANKGMATCSGGKWEYNSSDKSYTCS